MNGNFGPFGSADPAVKQFEQKFKDKTRNNWAQRDNFVPSAGKYTLIEVGEFEDASGSSATAAVASTGPKFSGVCSKHKYISVHVRVQSSLSVIDPQ